MVMEPAPISEQLRKLVALALRHGVERVEDARTDRMPFAFWESDEAQQYCSYATGGAKAALEFAWEQVEAEATRIERYAVGWYGNHECDGKSWDAIFIEAGEREAPLGHRVCLRFVLAAPGSANEKVGEPIDLDRPQSRIYGRGAPAGTGTGPRGCLAGVLMLGVMGAILGAATWCWR
jgi:hypothetical protein